MDDPQLDATLRAWLHRRDARRPDPEPLLGAVMVRLRADEDALDARRTPTRTAAPTRQRWRLAWGVGRAGAAIALTAGLVATSLALLERPLGPRPVGGPTDVAGLVTEVVEPGVLRVLDDGQGHPVSFGDEESSRQLDGMASFLGDRLLVAHHAERSRHMGEHLDAWVLDSWILGEPTTFPVDMPTAGLRLLSTTDGAIVAVGEGGWVARFDGLGWTVLEPQRDTAALLDASLDGSDGLWARWPEDLSNFRDGSWTSVDPTALGMVAQTSDCVSAMGTMPDGRLAIGIHADAPAIGLVDRRCGPDPLLAYDGAAWQPIAVPDTLRGSDVTGLVAAGDSLWVRAGTDAGTLLARRTDVGWQVHPLQPTGDAWRGRSEGRMLGRPDGSLWIVGGAAGLTTFDGTQLRTFLPTIDLRDGAVAADGTIWVAGPSALYAVPPDPGDR